MRARDNVDDDLAPWLTKLNTDGVLASSNGATAFDANGDGVDDMLILNEARGTILLLSETEENWDDRRHHHRHRRRRGVAQLVGMDLVNGEGDLRRYLLERVFASEQSWLRSMDYTKEAVVLDFDNDGDNDLYLCNIGGAPNRLLQNDGHGVFDDVSATLGHAVIDLQSRGNNCVFAMAFDADADGDMDIFEMYVTNADMQSEVSYRLLDNVDGLGHFEDVEEAFAVVNAAQGDGSDGSRRSTYAVAIDFDGDSHLDIFVCNTYAHNLVLINRMHTELDRFVKLTQWNDPMLYTRLEAIMTEQAFSMSALVFDANSDGHMDLYVVNAGQPSELYLQTDFDTTWGGTRFAAVDTSVTRDDDMAKYALAHDVNNDGELDLIVVGLRYRRVFLFSSASATNVEYTVMATNVIGGESVDSTGIVALRHSGSSWGKPDLFITTFSGAEYWVHTTNPEFNDDIPIRLFDFATAPVLGTAPVFGTAPVLGGVVTNTPIATVVATPHFGLWYALRISGISLSDVTSAEYEFQLKQKVLAHFGALVRSIMYFRLSDDTAAPATPTVPTAFDPMPFFAGRRRRGQRRQLLFDRSNQAVVATMVLETDSAENASILSDTKLAADDDGGSARALDEEVRHVTREVLDKDVIIDVYKPPTVVQASDSTVRNLDTDLTIATGFAPPPSPPSPPPSPPSPPPPPPSPPPPSPPPPAPVFGLGIRFMILGLSLDTLTMMSAHGEYNEDMLRASIRAHFDGHELLKFNVREEESRRRRRDLVQARASATINPSNLLVEAVIETDSLEQASEMRSSRLSDSGFRTLATRIVSELSDASEAGSGLTYAVSQQQGDVVQGIQGSATYTLSAAFTPPPPPPPNPPSPPPSPPPPPPPLVQPEISVSPEAFNGVIWQSQVILDISVPIWTGIYASVECTLVPSPPSITGVPDAPQCEPVDGASDDDDVRHWRYVAGNSTTVEGFLLEGDYKLSVTVRYMDSVTDSIVLESETSETFTVGVDFDMCIDPCDIMSPTHDFDAPMNVTATATVPMETELATLHIRYAPESPAANTAGISPIQASRFDVVAADPTLSGHIVTIPNEDTLRVILKPQGIAPTAEGDTYNTTLFVRSRGAVSAQAFDVFLTVLPESRLLLFPPRQLEARLNGYLPLEPNCEASVDTIWLINTAKGFDDTGILITAETEKDELVYNELVEAMHIQTKGDLEIHDVLLGQWTQNVTGVGGYRISSGSRAELNFQFKTMPTNLEGNGVLTKHINLNLMTDYNNTDTVGTGGVGDMEGGNKNVMQKISIVFNIYPGNMHSTSFVSMNETENANVVAGSSDFFTLDVHARDIYGNELGEGMSLLFDSYFVHHAPPPSPALVLPGSGNATSSDGLAPASNTTSLAPSQSWASPPPSSQVNVCAIAEEQQISCLETNVLDQNGELIRNQNHTALSTHPFTSLPKSGVSFASKFSLSSITYQFDKQKWCYVVKVPAFLRRGDYILSVRYMHETDPNLNTPLPLSSVVTSQANTLSLSPVHLSVRPVFCDPAENRVTNEAGNGCECMPGYYLLPRTSVTANEASSDTTMATGAGAAGGGGVSNDNSAITCVPCRVGTFSSSATLSGVEVCRACPLSMTTTRKASTSSMECVCGPGYRVSEETSAWWDPTSCVECQAGEYNSIANSTTCTLCPAGSYNPNTAKGSMLDCLLCLPNTISPEPGSDRCEDCAMGSYTPAGVSVFERRFCSCAFGFYNHGMYEPSTAVVEATIASSAMTAAAPSSSSSLTTTISSTDASVRYPIETGQACRVCPDGGECFNDLIFVKEGYWRRYPNETELYQCKTNLCLGDPAIAAEIQRQVAEAQLADRAAEGGITNALSTSGSSSSLSLSPSFFGATSLTLPSVTDDSATNMTTALLTTFSNETMIYRSRQLKPTPVTNLCREGHTGIACGVCIESYGYQGSFCKYCDPGLRYSNWDDGKLVLVAVLLGIGVLLLFYVFFYAAFRKNFFLVVASCLGFRPKKKKTVTDANGKKSVVTVDYMDEDEDEDVNDECEEEDPEKMNQMGFDRIAMKAAIVGAKISGVVKILITTYQIITGFDVTLDVQWPDGYTKVVDRLSMLNLEIFKFPKLSCINPEAGFETQFIFNFALLPAVMCITFIMYSIGRVMHRSHRSYGRFINLCIRNTVFCLFLLYVGVSRKILGTFACEKFYEQSFLAQDLTFQCYTAKHRFYMVMGVVGIMLYPVGIPLAFLVLLWRAGVPQMANVKLNKQLAHVILMTASDEGVIEHEVCRKFTGHTWDLPDDLVHVLWQHFCSKDSELKKLLLMLMAPQLANKPKEIPSPLVQRFHLVSWARRSPLISLKKLTWDVRVPEEKQALDKAGFLFADYHIGCWYWEVYDLCRKLVLSSVIIFVEPGKPSQILIGIIISFATLLLTVKMDPYIDGDINSLSEFALIVTFFTLLSGFSLKVNIVSYNDEYFNVLVTTLVLSVAALPFLYVIFAGYNIVGRQISWKLIAKYYKRVERKREELAAGEAERVAVVRREYTRRLNSERMSLSRELSQEGAAPRFQHSLSHRVFSEVSHANGRRSPLTSLVKQNSITDMRKANSDPRFYGSQEGRHLRTLLDSSDYASPTSLSDNGSAGADQTLPPRLQLNNLRNRGRGNSNSNSNASTKGDADDNVISV